MIVCKEKIEMMKAAYEYMYIIENTLRYLVQVKMTDIYGIHWHFVASRKYINAITKKDFLSLNYHELVSCYSIYPELNQVFPRKLIPHLHRITPIRNKIAHNCTITSEEFEFLCEVYQKIQVNKERSAI